MNSLPFSLILNTIAIDVHILTTAEASMESDAPAQFFDIEIRVLNPVSGEYPIEITLEDGAVARGTVPIEAFTWGSSGDTQKDGQRLFNTLLGAGRLREAWGATRSRQRRIRLRIDPPELHACRGSCCTTDRSCCRHLPPRLSHAIYRLICLGGSQV
jgi:hypothetical protein